MEVGECCGAQNGSGVSPFKGGGGNRAPGPRQWRGGTGGRELAATRYFQRARRARGDSGKACGAARQEERDGGALQRESDMSSTRADHACAHSACPEHAHGVSTKGKCYPGEVSSRPNLSRVGSFQCGSLWYSWMSYPNIVVIIIFSGSLLQQSWARSKAHMGV